MPIIPTPPPCGTPATHRVELYTPLDGRAHGSLDASLYVCDAHVDQVAAAGDEAGFSSVFRMQVPIGPKHCGDGFDFDEMKPLRSVGMSAAVDTLSDRPTAPTDDLSPTEGTEPATVAQTATVAEDPAPPSIDDRTRRGDVSSAAYDSIHSPTSAWGGMSWRAAAELYPTQQPGSGVDDAPEPDQD